MFGQVELTERQQHILWATVRHYVATAEPVGSKALVEEYNLSVSSATVRSGMGILEKAGLLYQPHTSAGRVPSDSGYRVYVDRLIRPSDTLAEQTEQRLSHRLHWETSSLEAVLWGAAQILSALSGYIALITLPQSQAAHLRYLQLLQVEPGQVMLIVVTDAYETQSTRVSLSSSEDDSQTPTDPEILDRELQILSNFLNVQLRGQPISELPHLDWGELDRQFQRYADTLKTVLADLVKRLQTPTVMPIAISGIADVLRQPEFSELQQVQPLMHLLEDEQDRLFPLVFEPSAWFKDKRVNIRIGAENPLEPIQSCTLVSATYRRGSAPVGSVSLLGPTRMAYEEAISMAKAAANYLSSRLGNG
ncbi:MAG: heat-inducible transcriptional repressor HrcA [Cyanobacteria bacterium SID2]|nr:heat-inducible transcriptional repressor HrcA [Cyanobacteria bacterium SID2]MBP0005340.1 heat-inducible transcriptional repressor HrcA [Cyanobacteria bacterium SBC]